MKRLRHALLAGLTAIAAGLGGTAQANENQGDPSDILGTWTFTTKPYRGGDCQMSGTMVLSPSPEKGVYACELTAIEKCSMWGQSVVMQSCTVRRFGDQVSVRSYIEEMLEVKPQAEGLVYVPDNFALTVQSENRMYGSLISAATAPVEFIRNLDGIG